MKRLFSHVVFVVLGLATIAGIIFGIDKFTADDSPQEYAHEFFINAEAQDDLTFRYSLGIYLPHNPNTNHQSWLGLDSDLSTSVDSFIWKVDPVVYEQTCPDCEELGELPNIADFLPSTINSAASGTKLTLVLNGYTYDYQLVVDGATIKVVSAADGALVSNEAKLYHNGVGRVRLQNPAGGSDACEPLTELEIEEFVGEQGVRLARSKHSTIDTNKPDDSVLVLAEGFQVGDLLAVDSETECSAYLDVINPDRVEIESNSL